MPTTSSEGETKPTGSDNSKVTRTRSKNRKKKRRLSCTSMEEMFRYSRHKRPKGLNNCLYKSFCDNFSTDSFYDSDPDDKLVVEEKLIWNRIKPVASRCRSKRVEDDLIRYSTRSIQNGTGSTNQPSSESKCWIDTLPHEILLKIFGYLPLGMLLHIIPQVCKKWEILALDWTLWKAVEDLTIKNMVISTSKLRTLLRTIPRLKKLELILRNDTEELLHEVFETHQNLEVLKLDRCYRSTLQMNILSQTVTSILEFCPKLKTVMLTDTYFHSKNFYRCLAKKFRNIERINVTCTTKSEMDIFMENLKEYVPQVEFQRVPMMGRADGKQIYWGPILGLVVRPIPTSPFHQQYIHDNYPNYAF